MALWQGKSRRKITGGRRVYSRNKRKFEIGREQQFATIGVEKRKLYRVKGANRKVRILRAQYVNVVDPKTHKTSKVTIKTVKENPANLNYVQRNIITKGATVDTDIGRARITSRPGQAGVLNAVLIQG